MKRAGLAVAIGAPLACLAVVSAALAGGSHAVTPARAASPQHPATASCTARPAELQRPLIGDAPGGPWAAQVARFTRAAGMAPGIVEYYTRFGTPFDAARACEVTRLGALPLIQWNPTHTSMAAIAAGRYDRYVASYARAARAFGAPVVLSFAHEMNGKWFSWGYTHTSPAAFVAAWRHVHDVFARARVRNVTWLWDINRDIHRSHPDVVSPPAGWWPGGRYVNWVGIDAYFNNPSDTFASVFDVTLAAVRQLTHAPVLITETAIGPGLQQAAQIRSLFGGVRAAPGVLGFVWFDQDRRERWHLENRPTALAVFRREARNYP